SQWEYCVDVLEFSRRRRTEHRYQPFDLCQYRTDRRRELQNHSRSRIGYRLAIDNGSWDAGSKLAKFIYARHWQRIGWSRRHRELRHLQHFELHCCAIQRPSRCECHQQRSSFLQYVLDPTVKEQSQRASPGVQPLSPRTDQQFIRRHLGPHFLSDLCERAPSECLGMALERN